MFCFLLFIKASRYSKCIVEPLLYVSDSRVVNAFMRSTKRRVPLTINYDRTIELLFATAYTSLLRREGDRLEYICFFNIFSNVSLLSDSFKLDGTVEGPY